jgi:hypothetical protein
MVSRKRDSARKPGERRQVMLAFLAAPPRPARAAEAPGPRVPVPVPRRARHVIRIPRTPAQLALPLDPGNLFIDEGARQVLERRLQQHLRAPFVLHVTDNRHTMVSFRRSAGLLRARLHHMFLDADAPVVEALARYITRGDRRSSLLLGRYIEDNRIRIKPSPPGRDPIRTVGSSHDLSEVLARVSRRYFGGDLDVAITWGRRAAQGRVRRSIKMGTYSHDERLIRIHPALDRPYVPRYFLEYLVFHEVLHHVLPSPTVSGRTVYHSLEFRDRERSFRRYDRALEWEKKHLGRLLRA